MADLYFPLLTVHNYFRWLVLLAALATVFVAAAGLFRPQPFFPWGRRTSLAHAVSLDIQLLLGLILFFLSPLVSSALSDMGAAMKVKELRFFTVEHTTAMLFALIFAHVGVARARKAATDRAKFARILTWNGISALLILIGIPWWRPLLRQ